MTLARWLDRRLGSIEDELPTCKRQIPWRHYIERLSYMDEENVEEIISRLRKFSREQKLPLAVMAVGSVLNKDLDRYNDVDLLLLPIGERDLASVETALAEFITQQPEVRRSRRAGKVKEGKWQDVHCYNHNRYWTLDFTEGKPVQLFICTGQLRRTLRRQIDMEIYAYGDYGRPYSILELT